VRRLATQAALGAGLLSGVWAVLLTARDGTQETANLFLDRGPVRIYHDEAVAMRAVLPAQAALAAPDTFRLVAFDTPFRYRFTHDMVARHVEGLSEKDAARRDACVAGVRYLVEASEIADEPGRTVFDVRRFEPGETSGGCAPGRG
jgi:hypothetical protein